MACPPPCIRVYVRECKYCSGGNGYIYIIAGTMVNGYRIYLYRVKCKCFFYFSSKRLLYSRYIRRYTRGRDE